MTVAAIKMESYNLGRPNEQLGGVYVLCDALCLGGYHRYLVRPKH